MTTRIAATIALSTGLFALVSVLAPTAVAQSANAGVTSSAVDTVAGRTTKVGGAGAVEAKRGDMRLWSFGECDRSFPNTGSAEHKDCVRVVGSDEAKDARAVHYCDVSHAKDPVEATHCKEAYFANKSEAEHEGFRANPSSSAPVVAPVVYTPKRDKAAEIAALTRALTAPDPEAPASAAADPAPGSAPAMEKEPQPSTFPTGTGVFWLSLMLLLAAVVIRQRRKAAEIDSLLKKSSHRVRNPKTMMNVPTKQY